MELTGYLQDKDLTMRKVLFLPAQGRLISLSINMAGPGSVLHFWEIEDSKVEKVTFSSHSYSSFSTIIFQIKTTVLDTIDSEVTSLTIDIHRNVLMMGTKGMRFIFLLHQIYDPQLSVVANIDISFASAAGDILQLHLWSFILDKEVITQVTHS